MWKLCVVDDESNRTDVDLVREEYSLGRAEECTVRLTERNISRNHARLFHDEENQWWLEDKESYTGSFVNGERVQSRIEVVHGDTVQLGDYRLELTDTQQQESSVEDSGQQAKPLLDRLTIVQGPGVGTVHELTDQKLLIGRGEECRIALDDASVSRVHVEIMRTEHGLMILDQGSSNGLRINGADLPSAMLRSGDVVELGDVRLKFTPAGTEDADASALVAAADVSPVGLSVAVAANRRPVLLYAAGAVGIAVLFFLFSGEEDESPTVATSRMGAEGAAVSPAATEAPDQALEEATALAARGSRVLAHRKLSGIPAGSPLRQTQAFLAVERQWADELLKLAADSPEREERRALLRKVAQTPGVGSERRTRAAQQLAKLEAEGELKVVDVSELPQAGPIASSGGSSASGARSRSKTSKKKTDSTVRKAIVPKPAVRKPALTVKPRSVAVKLQPKAIATKPASKAAGSKSPSRKPALKAQPSKVVSKSTSPTKPKAVASKPATTTPAKAKAPAASPPDLIRDNPF